MINTTIQKNHLPQNQFFLENYTPSKLSFDELKSGTDFRDHWKIFARSLERLSPGEFNRRWNEAKEQLRINGVTYNLHSDTRGMDRPWQLDPIPLLISENEENHLIKGLAQRALLLELILQDIYGPQRILKEKLLHPELIFANPNFHRACHGFKPAGNKYLYLLAVDLARNSNGTMHAISDRLQSPSGTGYALENRIVMTQMLPDIFNNCNVQRLAMFFRSFKETLKSIAPNNKDNPRTVLLTPGPRSETYFEHSYLARYLGLTLVEGGDLTVRDNKVYLKFLDGLHPVDVIMRRLDDRFCDPLELQANSLLGVPGLLQCARKGGVAIANSLGCSFMEAPSLTTYLPALCKIFLGQDLIIPGVPSYWCGDHESLKYVLNNLDNMVLKNAFTSRRSEPIFIETLSNKKREEFIAQLKNSPQIFVAQEKLQLSTVPVMGENGIEPRPLVLRKFLCSHNSDYSVMPGGLCRYSSSPSTQLISVQQGGGSKDTWVLSSGEVSTFSLLNQGTDPIEISRGGSDLPSRSADNLFWLGRYTERADGLARLLRGIFLKLIESLKIADSAELKSLLKILSQYSQAFSSINSEPSDKEEPGNHLISMVYDRDRIGTFANDLQAIYRTASSSRDRISIDMWRVISTLEIPSNPELNMMLEQPEHSNLITILDLLNHNIVVLAAFGGLIAESMTRGHAWRFLDMGRKIERASQTIRLLKGCMIDVSTSEIPLYESILEIADSLMTFRRRYLNKINPAAVLDLLLSDSSNPRSLVFQLNSLQNNINHLSKMKDTGRITPQEKSIMSMHTSVLLADIEHLVSSNESGKRIYLENLLNNLFLELSQLSESIAHHYLGHLQLSRHLSGSNS